MRITSRWGRNREHQLVALLGCGAVRVGGLRHHAAQFDDGAGALRSLLLRPVRRWSFCGGMGDGADSAIGDVSSQCPVLSSQFLTSGSLLKDSYSRRFWEGHGFQPCRYRSIKMPALAPEGVIVPAVQLAGLRRGRAEGGRLRRAGGVPAAKTRFC